MVCDKILAIFEKRDCYEILYIFDRLKGHLKNQLFKIMCMLILNYLSSTMKWVVMVDYINLLNFEIGYEKLINNPFSLILFILVGS